MSGHPNHLFVRGESCSLWVPRDLSGDREVRSLFDLDRLFSLPECEMIKDQRKIKVGRVPLGMGGKTKRVYLKRYNAFSWRYRLLSLLAPSAAFRAWTGAEILLGAGFHTGRPVAAVECRSWGMLTKSFYLSEEIPGGETIDLYWRDQLMPVPGKAGYHQRRNFLKKLAQLFRSLHDRNIYHNDLKDANILVCRGEGRREESFYLLDLEGIRKYSRLNRRRRVKNLAQLNRTMGKFLGKNHKACFLKAYLGTVFFDRSQRRAWIRSVLEQT